MRLTASEDNDQEAGTVSDEGVVGDETEMGVGLK